MIRRILVCSLGLFGVSTDIWAGTVTHLRDDWRVQSACKVQAGGDAIAVTGFATDGWLKTSVPSTVLAAQVAAGVLPDPYFGDNLRKIPGTSYPIGHNFANLPMPSDSPYACGWWYRKEFEAASAKESGRRFWLHFGGINYRGEVWLNGKRIADGSTVAGAYRTYDFDVTELLRAGKAQRARRRDDSRRRRRISASTGSTGIPVRRTRTWACGARSTWWRPGRSRCARRWLLRTFAMSRSNSADLTVYAELHNATAQRSEGYRFRVGCGAFTSSSPLSWRRMKTGPWSSARRSSCAAHRRIRSPGGLTRWANRTSST